MGYYRPWFLLIILPSAAMGYSLFYVTNFLFVKTVPPLAPTGIPFPRLNNTLPTNPCRSHDPAAAESVSSLSCISSWFGLNLHQWNNLQSTDCSTLSPPSHVWVANFFLGRQGLHASLLNFHPLFRIFFQDDFSCVKY